MSDHLIEFTAVCSSEDAPRVTVASFTTDLRIVWTGSYFVYTDGTRELATSRAVAWKAGDTLLIERQGHLLRVWVSADVNP